MIVKYDVLYNLSLFCYSFNNNVFGTVSPLLLSVTSFLYNVFVLIELLPEIPDFFSLVRFY